MESWERNVLGISDWTDPRWKLRGLLKHVKPEGAIVELGVYKGKSLLALALATGRTVWGYDSWSGLPEWTSEDRSWSRIWDGLSEDHRSAVIRHEEINPHWRERRFNDASRGALERKLNFLGLHGTFLIEGWPPCEGPEMIAAASLDCDLYQSYKDALPWVWERLSDNGYIHLDEYYSLKYPGARIAVDEFVKENSLEDCLKMHPRIPGEFERWYLLKS